MDKNAARTKVKIDCSKNTKAMKVEASPQINSLLWMLQVAEAIHQRVIPLYINGTTLVFKSVLFALPQTAKIPLGLV